MDDRQREMILRYRPHIYKDCREPFPIRYVGCTIFTEKARSESFPKWAPDPAAAGAQAIIEYAIYYDYDIQHLYDLEHIWVAVDAAGAVADCWCSFHGMRLRAAGSAAFRVEETHPVLYAQPGKHAMLPEPSLFALYPQLYSACMAEAGGGLLLPAFLADSVKTDNALDGKIASHIRTHYSFEPAMEFVPENMEPEQFLSWPALLARIPQLIAEQLRLIG